MDLKETRRYLEPKISVIIPFFNSKRTLVRAIESVISQKYQNWQLILIDDGSHDNSAIIAKCYLSDSKVNLVSQENKGVGSARNLGASFAKGEWLIFLDSDDFFEPNSFFIFEDCFRMEPNYSFFQFGINRIKKEGSVYQLPIAGSYFPSLSGSFIVKKAVFEEVGRYNERLKFSENTELFHRISLAGYLGKSVPKIVLNYFDNPRGGSKNLRNMIDSLTFILEKHAETLTPHVKHLYHQIIGVNWIRFRNFSQARHHLFQALKYKPTKLSTWGRFFLACLPIIARRLYSETVNHG